jgi:hypothetical protein
MSISEAFFKYDMNCDHSVILKYLWYFFFIIAGILYVIFSDTMD